MQRMLKWSQICSSLSLLVQAAVENLPQSVRTRKRKLFAKRRKASIYVHVYVYGYTTDFAGSVAFVSALDANFNTSSPAINFCSTFFNAPLLSSKPFDPTGWCTSSPHHLANFATAAQTALHESTNPPIKHLGIDNQYLNSDPPFLYVNSYSRTIRKLPTRQDSENHKASTEFFFQVWTRR